MSGALARLAASVQAEVAASHPDFVVEVHDGTVRLSGRLLLAEGSKVIDSYDIAVVLPSDYPRGIPDVYEVGGRIPWVVDRHMYPSGRACLFAPGERWRHWARGLGMSEFLSGPVRSFFMGQTHFELTGGWLFGERSHGALGIIEAYSEMLHTTDVPVIVRFIGVLSRRKLRPRSQCPCGSGRAIHSCHMRKLADLRSK
ncbi:MAG: hypothetical protein GEU90_21460, partial [Gemmatimonas sp.]|nr:hypothetical protein [Gemmatimonas sp.]